MPRYKDFLQYDDKPFGYGDFVLDDDSVHTLDDPERARSVLEELYGQDASPPQASPPSLLANQVDSEATNIAERGSADRKGEELSKRDLLENAAAKLAGVSEPNQPHKAFGGIDVGADPMRRAVAGPGGSDGSDELMSRDEETQSRLEPSASREPSREQVQDSVAAQNMAKAYSLVPRTKPGTDPRSLGPGVSVDKSYSREGGLTPDEYNRQAADRQSSYDATNQTVARHYQENEAAAAAQAEQLRAQALQLKQQNDAHEHELARKQAAYQDDRAWLEKDVDDYYDKKPDPDGGLRKERGLAGNIGSAIAQMMGAYAAVITGTPNFANQILNRKIDEHVNAQVEDFRRGRMKRDGQMQRMAERGMSLEQMKSALKLQQELAIQKEVKAAALNEGSREAKQAAESLLMDRQERFTTEENKFRTEALGKQTVSGEFVRPTGPKALTPLERMQEANKVLEARVQGDYLARGGAPAERAEERDIKRGEQQGKQQGEFESRMTAYSKERQETIPQLNKTDRDVARVQQILKQHGGLPGVGKLDASGVLPNIFEQGALADELSMIRDRATTTLQNMTPGNHSDADRINSAKELLGSGSETDFMHGIALLNQLSTDKRAEIESSVSDDVRSAYEERRKKQLVEAAKRKRRGAGAGEDY